MIKKDEVKLGLFFTTAIMTIIIEINVFHNVYS